MDTQIILTQAQTLQKIKRIAYEIYENNYKENRMALAGIFDKGYFFAQLLKKALSEIVPELEVQLIKVSLDKFAPTQSDIKIDIDLGDLKGNTVVLVDDVLNSGKTLAYSLKPFLGVEIKKIQIAVLVDRGHKSFPVAADYVGYSLSTALKEHVEVAINEHEVAGVFLK